MEKVKCFFVFCAIINCTNAQTNLTNLGQFFISNSTDTVFISGSLINNVGATLNNAGGNLFVKQDVTNNEINMNVGGGKLWTTGSIRQTFYGTTPFKTHNWIVNNNNDVELQNRVEVGNGSGGSLSFASGKIYSGTNLQDVCFNVASNYTGYSNTNHIIGFCTKRGGTNFTFPIGDGTYKADLDITNLSSSNEFQCKYFGNVYSSLAATLPLVSVFDKEYWILDRITGSSGANITLKWNDARKILNHTAFSGLRVGHFTGASWVSEGGTGSGNTAAGTVTSIMVNSFSPFTFASEGAILPIHLNSFSTEANSNCDVNVKWQASNESNVKIYYLQKMINNRWENIHAITPQKNTSVSYYTFVDDKTIAGINMYRIITELISGTILYSETSQVATDCNNGLIKVYPTVTNSEFTIETPTNISNATITLTNVSGQVVYQKNNISLGKFKLDISMLSAGVYSVIIDCKIKKEMFSIIKQ